MPIKDNSLRIGLVTTVSGRFPKELPRERHAWIFNWLEDTFSGCAIIKSEDIVVDDEDIKAAIEKFHQQDADLIIIFIGAFTGDNVSAMIAEKLDLPIILWAFPEPPFNGGRIMSNALVSATMNSSSLKRLGYKSHFVYGSNDDSKTLAEISSYIKIYFAKKKLRNTFLGLIGYRPTGFYSSQFDETLIRKTFGVAMEEFDLVHLINVSNEIDEEEIEKDMKGFISSVKCSDLPEEYIRNHSRLYLGLKKIIVDNKFDAMCLRCWPELGFMKYTPCGVISRLADDGIIIGCEADVDATLSMLIQNYLTGEMVFMNDLINIEEKDNTALFWHCGQAGRKLHRDNENSCACDHSLAGQGIVIEGTLKPGPVTICRMSNIGNGYKLFIEKGEALPTEEKVRGASINVKMAKPVREIIYNIAKEGIPHHYSIVWEDVYEDMRLFAENMGIEVIET